MVRIINAFREDRPVGAMIAQLGNTLFGDQASGEINRQQAYALQRSNAETDNLMALARGGGLETLTPAGQAMLIGSGYDPNDLGRVGALGAATQFGARDDRTTNWSAGLGEYGGTAEAFDFNLANQRGMNDADNAAALARQNALPQPALDANGNPVFTTQGGTAGFQPILTDTEQRGRIGGIMFPDMPAANQAAYLNAEPQTETVRGPGGVPTIAAVTDAIGQPAAVGLDTVRGGVAQDALAAEGGLAGADPTTQAFIGADAGAGGGTPRNYIDPDGTVHITYDGVTDAQTGVPLPPGGQLVSTALQGTAADLGIPTPSVLTDLQSDLIATDKFNQIVDMMMPLTDDPSNFGVPGWVQSRMQELAQGIGGVANWIRPQDAAALAEFLPDIYNPDLTEVQTLGILLLYQGAAALAGQQGRSVSDADIRLMRQAIPNPFGIFTSAQSMRAALETARNVINGQRAVVERAMQGVGGGGAAPAAAPAATPLPTGAGNLTPNPDGTFTWAP